MKLALDPQMFYATSSVYELPDISCVFGFEEDARGVSERQRDKALALIGKHFGGDAEAAVRSTKLVKEVTS
jgi:hypothetical protein